MNIVPTGNCQAPVSVKPIVSLPGKTMNRCFFAPSDHSGVRTSNGISAAAGVRVAMSRCTRSR